MACENLLSQFDDQSFALQLQLEEIEAQREYQSGKWREDAPPDFALAFNDFEAELRKAIVLVEDLKFAHSIARAVDSDGFAVEESRIEEMQAAQDRDFALSLSEGGNPDALGLQTVSRVELESINWDHVLCATEASTLSNISESTVAGPSTHYTLRQKSVLAHLPQLKVECVVCGDSVHPHGTVRLDCKDIYCKPCLKIFFLRVTNDESLFPPKCHRQDIDISLIEAELSVEELAAYRNAVLEFTSTDRIYCSNLECAKFVPATQRTQEHASCDGCGARTCMHCKRQEHDGVCPADKYMQDFINFAGEQGWQSCVGCGEMVARDVGCDHMTCRCSAQFCYRCGVKWKECQCDDWVPELLDRRAQEVVDREVRLPMAPAVRQQRVDDMAEELRENHECNHSGRFTKIEGSRRGQTLPYVGLRRLSTSQGG